jgi:hypothetical protein
MGLYLYPCPNTTPSRLRVQHLMPKLKLRRQCPSRIRHQLVPSLYRATSPRISRKLPFKSANSPFAERQHIADCKRPLLNPLRRFFLAEWYFITKLGPQVSLFPVPFFGFNKEECHHVSNW